MNLSKKQREPPDTDRSGTSAQTLSSSSPSTLKVKTRPTLARSQAATEQNPQPSSEVEGDAKVKTQDWTEEVSNVNNERDSAFASGLTPIARGGASGSTKSAAGAAVAGAADSMTAQSSWGRGNHGPRGSQAPGVQQRVSQIKDKSLPAFSAAAEERSHGGMSPASNSTASSHTLRGSAATTPYATPLRTPSYPFPSALGTPRRSLSSFHQPFTTLSPTVLNEVPDSSDKTPRKSSPLVEEKQHPEAKADFFAPGHQRGDDSRFPTPNLYELVLHLNAEAGLDAWWSTLTALLRDQYKADRVTLVVPSDPTDLENSPWGQKAIFSTYNQEEYIPNPAAIEHTMGYALGPSSANRSDFGTQESFGLSESNMQHLHSNKQRPKLESRHSYAAPSASNVVGTAAGKSTKRPSAPRMATHSAGMPVVKSHHPQIRSLPQPTIHYHSLTDPDFSSVADGIETFPFAEVFKIPRTLNFESHPLIDSAGVNRVLERGELVTVTRNSAPEASEPGQDHKLKRMDSEVPMMSSASRSNVKSPFDDRRNLFTADDVVEMRRDYEEYEQYPASPWAQSPAPSPAIQADEENNPFFPSTSQQVEESFNPVTTPKDYSQFNQVEAIGLDQSSTILHVPLIHPTLSQSMESLRLNSLSNAPKYGDAQGERRAPIAILSVLSPTVPYPHNLTQSLKLLGPHLATSYATGAQFSTSQARTVALRHRKPLSVHNILSPTMAFEPSSLDRLVNADIEEPRHSIAGSVTSPSDYSGQSRHSPTGSSFAGTPGWDQSTHAWAQPKSVSGTPVAYGADKVDNYFDSKRRHSRRSGGNGGVAAHATPSRMNKEHFVGDSNSGHEDLRAATRENKAKPEEYRDNARLSLHSTSAEEHGGNQEILSSASRIALRHSLSPFQNSQSHRHTLLHSFGADFQSSFGALPAATAIEPRTPGNAVNAHEPSYGGDMLPPSERLLRTIIDSLPVQIFTAEPDTGKLTWVNSKFLIYRGQDPKQALDQPWQAIHREDRLIYMDCWNRSLRTGQQLQQKVRLQRFDGNYRWFYVRAAPLKDKKQNIVHWIGTNMDFHEQHIAEMNSAKQQETAASEAKYRALANSSPQVVFAVDRTKGVTFCNTRWLFYSGQTEDQALGVGFMDHIHPDDLAKCRLPTFEEHSESPVNVPTSVPPEPRRQMSTSGLSSSGSSETEKAITSSSDGDSSPLSQLPQRKLSELAATGILKVSREADGRPSYTTEVRLKSKDGEYRWHLVRVLLAEPLMQSTGSTEETWYGTCSDINDHKALERDLKETMDEKSRFLSNMSHEIRTPLNGITGMVNFLIDSSLSAEQMEHVNIIRASTEGLRGLINDILDLSKAEAGMIQLSMEWLHVRALIEEVNDLTSTMAIDKGLELNYLVESDVPSQIKGDRFRIRQILLNIVGNAIKFTQQGEVFVRCTAHENSYGTLASNEKYVKFEVIDTGQGFTDKEANYLFKRFSQIDGSSTRQHGGSGLGLSISKMLALLHGGDITAKGIPGKGATFTFYVKVTVPSERDKPPMPPATPGVRSNPKPLTPGSVTVPLSAITWINKPSGHSTHENQADALPKFASTHTSSPLAFVSPEYGKGSPTPSSASSGRSLLSMPQTNSSRSERSSASSIAADQITSQQPTMSLALPQDSRFTRHDASRPTGSAEADHHSSAATGESRGSGSIHSFKNPTPPMYSILVMCPLKYSREATQHHIEKTLPDNAAHQITAEGDFEKCRQMFGEKGAIVFSHVVLVLKNTNQIIALMNQIMSSTRHSNTTIIIITDLAQRRSMMEQEPMHDWEKHYDSLILERRLRFVFKPLKPSRFAEIFDPQKEREMSTDHNHDSAQQVALHQKQVFEELARRLGNKDKRVLLVEDNRVNQMVILKFLAKVSITVETVMDGVQCTNKVFSHPYGYYSIILCDLHMPNKDGYQTCKEIRKWERQNNHQHLPIIALSANVLGDVQQKCIDAGFNSYLTKPVDFKELSTVLMDFLDPQGPVRQLDFMKKRRTSRHHVR